MFQHLVESFPRIVEAVIAAKWGPTPYQCPWFWNEMMDEQVSKYFWWCSVYIIFIHDIKDSQITSKWAQSEFNLGNLFPSIPTHTVNREAYEKSYPNLIKVWNYSVFLKYYICLGFLQSICSVQMIYNYVSGLSTIRLTINWPTAECNWGPLP
jgi:hypothetical protein